MPNLNTEILANIPIAYPDLPQQKAMATILDNIDSKISLNNAINIELEKAARLLYDYWFVQFDFPNAEGKPYRASGGKMVYNEQLKRKIPKGWKVEKLGNIGEFKNGVNYEKANANGKIVKIVNVRDISSSTAFIDNMTLDEIILPEDEIEKYLLNENDMIIARSGIPGATRMIAIYENTIFCGFAIRFRLEDANLKEYIYFVLKQNEQAATSKSSGSIMPNISQDILKDVETVLPDTTIQKVFQTAIRTFFAQIAINSRQSAELTALRDFLLPLLMNGQVTVAAGQ
jgi:type I restriction enzyme S subunit